jgi:hypothetical protein
MCLVTESGKKSRTVNLQVIVIVITEEQSFHIGQRRLYVKLLTGIRYSKITVNINTPLVKILHGNITLVTIHFGVINISIVDP